MNNLTCFNVDMKDVDEILYLYIKDLSKKKSLSFKRPIQISL